MRIPVLSDAERRLLKNYKAESPHKLVVKKAEALFLLSRDVSPEVVAEFVDREPSTLKDWVVDWEKQRMASLYTGHAGNLNRSFFTQEQREAVLHVLAQPPGPEYLPAQFQGSGHGPRAEFKQARNSAEYLLQRFLDERLSRDN